jgi:hypothetical protein
MALAVRIDRIMRLVFPISLTLVVVYLLFQY